jgi:hypothetical protein
VNTRSDTTVSVDVTGEEWDECPERSIPMRKGPPMVILLALLIVLLVAGLGFTFHLLWILAGVLFVLWLIGFVIGRGEGAGSRHFYNW